MTKIISVSIALLLGLASLTNAQEPISFRSSALGGVIDDDLDLIYDQIELRFVDGIRLYTNLSNLTSTHEQLFENTSDDEFLIGLSAQNPFSNSWWTSALVCFQNSETSNLVAIDSDLDGFNDISGEGKLIDEYTAYLDTDADGLYDLKNMISQEKTDFTTDDSYSLILNNTLNTRGLTLGAKVSFGSETYVGDTASSFSLGSGYGVLSPTNMGDPTFSRSVTTHLIEDEYDGIIWSENGDFHSEWDVGYKSFDVSVMTPWRGFETRGDIQLFFSDNLNEANDGYSGYFEYFYPDISNYDDRYSEHDSYISKTEDDGSGISFGGSLRKTFAKQHERKNDGYWKVGAYVSFDSYDYTNSTSFKFSSTETYFDGLDTLFTDFERMKTQDDLTEDDGTEKVSTYAINSRFNIPLGRKVLFGMGGYLRYSKVNRETDYIESLRDVENYDYTDPDNDDFDYITTVTAQLTADRDYEVFTTTFTCPVGLEYRIGKEKNWSLRVGTIFRLKKQKTNDAKQITDSEPMVTETVYGDGGVNIVIEDNIYESTSEQTRETTSSTVFTYGIGYKPTNNLQVDLLGFWGTADNSILDTSFYRNLRLSFTMKF